jgi:hypothetical protein
MEDVWLLSEFNSTLDIGGHLGNEAQGSTRFDIGVVAARRMADNDQRKLATHFPVGWPLLKRMINWKANSKGPPAAVNENNETKKMRWMAPLVNSVICSPPADVSFLEGTVSLINVDHIQRWG